MYTGLSLMNAQELAEITRLIGVDEPPDSLDVLFDIVSGWLARTVKKEGRAQEEVERCVLEWTAQLWRIIVPEGTDTNDLERSLRLKIAHDAVEFLAPSWAICCSLIASGKKANIELKLDMMENAVATAVPSSRARAAKREEWNEMCRRWSALDPLDELEPYIEAIKVRPELQSECLTLGLALSLLDGSIGYPTEKLYKNICDQLDIGTGDAADIKKRVSDLYWKFHNAAQPTESGEDQGAIDPIRAAARQTVYGAGALESLAAEARQELFASLEPAAKPKSGWSKFVGGLSGMSPFFSSKMKDDTHATLARVVYHTILKQHDAVVVAARKAHAKMASVLAAAPEPEPTPTRTPAPAPKKVESKVELTPQPGPTQAAEPAPKADKSAIGLSELMVEKSKPMKSIKLDL
jgi:hypothetical protein